MAQKHIFLKEVIKPEGKTFEGYTTLTGILRSEGLMHIYGSVRYVLLQQNIFQSGNIIFRRINLNHQKHGKSKRRA